LGAHIIYELYNAKYMEVYEVGDEMKQCFDRDRCDRCDREPIIDDCECGDDGWNFGEWLPLLIIIFLLCGGTNILGGFGGFGGFGGNGGNGCRSDCGDNNGFGGGWLLILVLAFLFLGGNQRCGKDGFLGGLFG
jgi:hypothetical protein